MKRRLTALAAVALTTVGISAVIVTNAGASSTPAPDGAMAINAAADISPQVMAALQRDLKLTADQITARLTREDRASRA